jgi:hypothetical protein
LFLASDSIREVGIPRSALPYTSEGGTHRGQWLALLTQKPSHYLKSVMHSRPSGVERISVHISNWFIYSQCIPEKSSGSFVKDMNVNSSGKKK